jgi:tetratricopeptide (TPR) repeat protein
MKAHFGLGYTLVDDGRPEEAYGHLKAYADIVPRNSWAWVWLGRACEAMGELDEARSCYRRAMDAEEEGSYETDADELLANLCGGEA